MRHGGRRFWRRPERRWSFGWKTEAGRTPCRHRAQREEKPGRRGLPQRRSSCPMTGRPPRLTAHRSWDRGMRTGGITAVREETARTLSPSAYTPGAFPWTSGEAQCGNGMGKPSTTWRRTEDAPLPGLMWILFINMFRRMRGTAWRQGRTVLTGKGM